MTRPGGPPATGGGDVLEIDAMDLAEWERDQRTPQASVANLAALVKQSARPAEPVDAPLRKTPLLARARATGPVAPRPPRAIDLAPGAERPARPARSDKITPVVLTAITRDMPPAPMVPAAGSGASEATTLPSPSTSAAQPGERATAPRPSPSAARPRRSPSAVPPPRPAVTRSGSSAVPPPSPAVARSGSSAVPPPSPAVARSGSSAVPSPSPAAARPTPSVPPPSPADATISAEGATPGPRVAQPPSAADALPGPRVVAAGTGAPRSRRGSIAERDLDVTPSSSRPLSSIRAGVARPGSAVDEVRHAALADLAAASEPQPTLDDLGYRAPLAPVPDAPVPAVMDVAAIVLPLPPAEPAPRPYPLAVPDLASPPPAHHDRDAAATRGRPSSPSPSPSRRRWLWIGGAAGGVAMVVVLVLVLVRGGRAGGVEASALRQDRARVAVVVARAALAPPVAPVPAPSEPPAPTAPSAGSSLPAPPLASATAAPPGTAPIRPIRAPVRKLGGKKLVVEYGGQPGEAAMPATTAPTTDDPAIGRARSAYLHGNQQLFAGDTEGALRAYRQALSLYPGYVGGYRGLGLAYTQLGDRLKALEAFRTYVTTVPGAKDVALIKKRIARLSAK